jgi:hypothetical protein
MGRAIRRGIPVVVLAVSAIAVASASAATGQITRALATPDWSQPSIAGSVTWTGCELEEPKRPPEKEPPKEEGEEELPPVGPVVIGCNWTPFVTIGPGTEASECSAPGRQQPEALGPGIALAWKGSKSSAEGTVGFEISEFPLNGSKNQLVCLSMLEELEVVMAAKPLTSYGPSMVSRPLASAFLTAEPSRTEPTKPCTCPAPSPPRKHRHHRRHRHRHRISLSQHQKVS